MAGSSNLPKYGVVAFSLCVVELVGIWIPFAVVPPTASVPWLLKIFGILYLVGLLSIPVAIIGLCFLRTSRARLRFSPSSLGSQMVKGGRMKRPTPSEQETR